MLSKPLVISLICLSVVIIVVIIVVVVIVVNKQDDKEEFTNIETFDSNKLYDDTIKLLSDKHDDIIKNIFKGFESYDIVYGYLSNVKQPMNGVPSMICLTYPIVYFIDIVNTDKENIQRLQSINDIYLADTKLADITTYTDKGNQLVLNDLNVPIVKYISNDSNMFFRVFIQYDYTSNKFICVYIYNGELNKFIKIPNELITPLLSNIIIIASYDKKLSYYESDERMDNLIILDDNDVLPSSREQRKYMLMSFPVTNTWMEDNKRIPEFIYYNDDTIIIYKHMSDMSNQNNITNYINNFIKQGIDTNYENHMFGYISENETIYNNFVINDIINKWNTTIKNKYFVLFNTNKIVYYGKQLGDKDTISSLF